ncbi:MAG: type 4a pilus biogenesis protein PilO [Candidatus Shapirobacteria bacterium]|nr:type 4a pilus biogenesis protein PilO [Candidatus Shapirobacteria bacterium]
MTNLNWQSESHRYRRYFVDLNKLYQTKKGRVYTGIVFSLIVIILFIFFAIRPTLITIAQLIRQIKDQKIVATALEKKINNLTEAQKNYLTIENNLSLIEEALPQKANLPLLTKQIETLARQAGIVVVDLRFSGVNLSPGKSTQDEKEEVIFSFNTLGEYSNLKKFLSSLTELRRIIIVESFSFQAGKDETNILSLNLNGKAWFLEKP